MTKTKEQLLQKIFLQLLSTIFLIHIPAVPRVDESVEGVEDLGLAEDTNTAVNILETLAQQSASAARIAEDKHHSSGRLGS